MSDGSELTLVTQRALARADLSECETLHLWTAKVHDLSPLRRAKRLAKVVLYQTSVTDLAPLAGLALRELHLYENPELRDPSPIGAIESLASLDLEVPRAVRFVRGSLRPLGTLRRLRRLAVWSAPYARLDWLPSLEGLRDLLVRGCRVRGAWVAGLTRLRGLDLDRCAIDDVRALSGLRDLRALSLAANGLADVRGLEGLPDLRFLSVAHNRLTSLAPLTALERLVRLDVDYNHLARLPRDLAGWGRLEALNLRHNRLEDVGPLRALRRLQTLRLDENRLRSVAPLAGLRRLAYLHLTQNHVRDLTPLARLRALVVLECAGNPAPVASLFALPALVRIDGAFTRDQPR